jgi:chromosomal replication initiation ATPase DnaA
MLSHPFEVPGVLEILQSAQDQISSIVGKKYKLYAISEEDENKEPLHIIKKRDRIIKDSILEVCELQEWKQVESKKRRRELVVARQLYCYFAKQYLKGLTLKTIGMNIGNRDHTTAIHGIQTVNALLDIQDDDMCWKVKQVSNKLKAKLYEDKAVS